MSRKSALALFSFQSFLVDDDSPVALTSTVFGQDVLTYHNNNARTGLNPQETTLTLGNVIMRRSACCSCCRSMGLWMPSLSISLLLTLAELLATC